MSKNFLLAEIFYPFTNLDFYKLMIFIEPGESKILCEVSSRSRNLEQFEFQLKKVDRFKINIIRNGLTFLYVEMTIKMNPLKTTSF